MSAVVTETGQLTSTALSGRTPIAQADRTVITVIGMSSGAVLAAATNPNIQVIQALRHWETVCFDKTATYRPRSLANPAFRASVGDPVACGELILRSDPPAGSGVRPQQRDGDVDRLMPVGQ